MWHISVGIRDFPNSPTFICNPGIRGGPWGKLAICQGSSLETQNHLSGDGDVSSLKYCWMVQKSGSHQLILVNIPIIYMGFIHPKGGCFGISEPSTVLRCVCVDLNRGRIFCWFIRVYVGDVALKRVLLGEPIQSFSYISCYTCSVYRNYYSTHVLIVASIFLPFGVCVCVCATLGGGLNHYSFSPLPGEMMQFDYLLEV